jgi:hypothetical protein
MYTDYSPCVVPHYLGTREDTCSTRPRWENDPQSHENHQNRKSTQLEVRQQLNKATKGSYDRVCSSSDGVVDLMGSRNLPQDERLNFFLSIEPAGSDFDHTIIFIGA